jgi:hypothetical protein
MAEKKLSKRKLESYKRAEITAQALRKYVTAGPRVTQADLDTMMDCLLDWMEVTGDLKYQDPVRRGRKKFR